MARVNLRRDWQEVLAKHAAVQGGSRALGGAIAKDAKGRTAARTGAARESIKVVSDGDETYVTGGGGRGWVLVFQEVGGRGFRPPPMPIRRAAAKYGVRTSKGR